MIKHSAFFGDAQREFALNPKLIAELERVTGAGIGGLSKRFFAGEFKSSRADRNFAPQPHRRRH